MTGSPSTIEVLIPTFNEAHHIAEAVANAKQLGRVFVLDSCSTDGTQQIARDAGATVIEHPFEGYAKQKNWALDHLPWQGEWVFILDADERITPRLRDELLRVAALSDAADGYYINRLLIFLGRPIRHGGLFPSWNLRFFRRGKARYEDRRVHEHMFCDGKTGYLKPLMLHVPQMTISEYLAKHIVYADLESDEWIRRSLGNLDHAVVSRLFQRGLRVRQWIRRRVWPHMPCRPLLRFCWMYVVRFGFLDGRAGWRMANLMASYEYMITLLYHDKQHRIREGTLSLDAFRDGIVVKTENAVTSVE